MIMDWLAAAPLRDASAQQDVPIRRQVGHGM
jgi:hypothetical protein